jgi:hypothetical protein
VSFEDVQKFFPWAIGLPTAPKIILSLLIGGAAAFILFLIWAPLPVLSNKDRPNQPSGSIDDPRSDQMIGRNVVCAGSAMGIPPDMHLWLAVETGSLIWPKREVFVDANGKWSTTIFEDGATRRFSISLLIASPEAHAQILEWLEVGRRQGQYAELKGIPGADRIARVDKLRLK